MSELPSKADLRRQVRERLRAVPDAELAVWSQELVCALQAREDLWATPGTVAIFGGLRNEPDLITGLLPWLTARGWRVVLFAVDGVELRPFEVTGMHDLKRGMLGIWEPVADPLRAVPLVELTLILVPGLAFSQHDGSRLGRGGGFYDRFLARPEVTATRVGICFESQLFAHLPCEAHDAQVSELMTEKRAIIAQTSTNGCQKTVKE
ncbi:5-formyltetrahydrofolate cyclo-ligase [Prosthecobacter sp. SYSU 5D2]|uniref:5-formyltetrahydrofolate cyclo-ligase n=1 Tax=Prosthecobacter sp. SYSU 5D2 TaxID=3134134 RepID=UPI0031FF06F8